MFHHVNRISLLHRDRLRDRRGSKLLEEVARDSVPPLLFRAQPFSAESRILSTTSRLEVNQTSAGRLKKLDYKKDAFNSRLCKALWTRGWTRPWRQTQPQSLMRTHVIRLPSHWMSTKMGGKLGRLRHQSRCRMTCLCLAMDWFPWSISKAVLSSQQSMLSCPTLNLL